MIAVGVANPSAQGQAIIRTAIVAVRANTGDGPKTSQATIVSAARTSTIGTK